MPDHHLDDRGHLLRFVQRVQMERQHQQMVAKALNEASPAELAKSGPGALPGDPRPLRFVPVTVGRGGLGGAQPGTHPEREIMRRLAHWTPEGAA